MKKEFRATPASSDGSYGPRIQISTEILQNLSPNEYLAIHNKLAKLSTWGGNTSSRSDLYNMWEFPLKGNNYADACSYLMTAKWVMNNSLGISF